MRGTVAGTVFRAFLRALLGPGFPVTRRGNVVSGHDSPQEKIIRAELTEGILEARPVFRLSNHELVIRRSRLWNLGMARKRGLGAGEMAKNGVLIGEYDASRRRDSDARLLEEVQRLERRIFPKHESLARSFEEELRKKNTGLIYAAELVPSGGRGEVVGYCMYTLASSLCASVTKLAGIFSSGTPRLARCGFFSLYRTRCGTIYISYEII